MTPGPLNRILYVEDEEDIQTVAKIALETLGGFTLRVCGSGAEALQEAPAFRPQLILLDVMMPGMDGPSTLKSLRTLPGLENIPVVFMTAKVQPGEIAHFLEMGAVEVIAKPFDPMTLSDKIQDIWKGGHG
ncbi:MAG TPA: response regulator [Planctomycetota bacterium]